MKKAWEVGVYEKKVIKVGKLSHGFNDDSGNGKC